MSDLDSSKLEKEVANLKDLIEKNNVDSKKDITDLSLSLKEYIDYQTNQNNLLTNMINENNISLSELLESQEHNSDTTNVSTNQFYLDVKVGIWLIIIAIVLSNLTNIFFNRLFRSWS